MGIHVDSIDCSSSFWNTAQILKSQLNEAVKNGEPLRRLRNMEFGYPSSCQLNNYGSYEKVGFVSKRGEYELIDIIPLVNDKLPVEIHSYLCVLCSEVAGKMRLSLMYSPAFFHESTVNGFLSRIVEIVKRTVIDENDILFDSI